MIGGTLYVGGSAYDADGAVGCAGTPTVCTPGWLDTFKDVLQTGPTDPSHLRFRLVRKVIRGFEHSFVLGHQVPQRSNCPIATDGIAHCKQLWTGSLNFDAPGAGTASEPAVADGRVFASYNLNHRHTVVAFVGTSASGLQLWNADFPNALGTTVAVGRGTVVVPFLTEAGWVVAALDAAGVNNCTATQCQPMWVTDPSRAPTAAAPAIAGGVVYVAAGSELRGYDLAGAGNCGGTPRTCLPLWTAAVGAGATAPTVANGVVYTSSADGSISVFDARDLGLHAVPRVQSAVADDSRTATRSGGGRRRAPVRRRRRRNGPRLRIRLKSTEINVQSQHDDSEHARARDKIRMAQRRSDTTGGGPPSSSERSGRSWSRRSPCET